MFLAVKCGSIIFVMNNVLVFVICLIYLFCLPSYNNVNVSKLMLAMMCLLLLLSIQRCINDDVNASNDYSLMAPCNSALSANTFSAISLRYCTYRSFNSLLKAAPIWTAKSAPFLAPSTAIVATGIPDGI